MFVDCFGDGKCRVFDVSNPHKPKQIYEKQIGKQVNMVSQSWDGKRLYFTSSLLANWGKKGADNEQFMRAYSWDGKELEHAKQFGPNNWKQDIHDFSLSLHRSVSCKHDGFKPSRLSMLAMGFILKLTLVAAPKHGLMSLF